jgi:hypothetical protein
MSYMIKNCIGPFKTGIGASQDWVTFSWRVGGDEDVKHSTGEGWASDVSRPRTWDCDGPHIVSTTATFL